MAQPSFDPDKYLSEKAKAAPFDPDKYLSEKNSAGAPAPPPAGSKLETAVQGFGNGLTLGYAPQLQALSEKYIVDPLASSLYDLPPQPDESYVQKRDKLIQRQEDLFKENPKTALGSQLAGGAASGLATMGLMPEVAGAKAATLGSRVLSGAIQGGKAGAVIGAVANPGDTKGEVSALQIPDRIANTAKGGLTGAVLGGATPLVAEGVTGAAQGLSGRLKDFAEKTALNATGATGKQVSQFGDNAGRELLDQKIVRFGDTQSKISSRATQALDDANSQIDESLKKLADSGVTVDENKIREQLANKISSMGGDASNADVVKLLNSELENISNASTARGSSELGVDLAEQTKRGYNRKAGNWADPEKGQAGKVVYQEYRNAVENAATEANPGLAEMFKKGKESYGLLAPIQEAAERRAATTSQSPAGGLLDVSSAALGFAKGGPLGAVAAPIARRVIAPRLASSIATSSDALANQLARFGEIAGPSAETSAINTPIQSALEAVNPRDSAIRRRTQVVEDLMRNKK